MKKIVAISMVKNEMDIIESFVRHTLGFADLLIVADHKSTDRTREILESLQAEGLPLIIEDVAQARHVGNVAWHMLLQRGAYPSRGLAGVLVRREVFRMCGGLVELLAEWRMPMLRMWRALLSAVMEQPCRWLAVLHDDYTRPVKEPSIEDIAAHQMEWHALCIEDATLLQENEQAAVLDRQRRIGIYLLEHAIASGIDLQSNIWPEYQQMLATL
ncbi:MAG: glycosyltransferase family 2 protein [Veillonellaceae bacterium]|nr:glycosyltransferase family 2 protein [Veillonellaceae bacterium]